MFCLCHVQTYVPVLAVKPKIEIKRTSFPFEKGMKINCTLKNSHDVNPKEISYTWFSCNSPDMCDKDLTTIRKSSPNFMMVIDDQSAQTMRYLCRAENEGGSDNATIDIYKLQMNSKCTLVLKHLGTVILEPGHDIFRDGTLVGILVCIHVYLSHSVYTKPGRFCPVPLRRHLFYGNRNTASSELLLSPKCFITPDQDKLSFLL